MKGWQMFVLMTVIYASHLMTPAMRVGLGIASLIAAAFCGVNGL